MLPMNVCITFVTLLCIMIYDDLPLILEMTPYKENVPLTVVSRK